MMASSDAPSTEEILENIRAALLKQRVGSAEALSPEDVEQLVEEVIMLTPEMAVKSQRSLPPSKTLSAPEVEALARRLARQMARDLRSASLYPHFEDWFRNNLSLIRKFLIK